MALKRTALLILWVCAPIFVLVGCFGFIAVMNWDYALKFFQPALIHGQADPWLGSKLLATAAAFGLGSSLFVFLALYQISLNKRFKSVLAILVSLICFLMALAFIVLGPAAITMLEQMS